MAYIGKTLASGYAQTFVQIIYTAPSSAVIKQFQLSNTDSTTESVTVYHNGVFWFTDIINGLELYEPLGGVAEIPLTAGDTIAIKTSNNDAQLYYRIFGAEFN